jgi:methylenetetrahydrofolate dehydrogenase (NADP+) / methenyltetrahydrofolate cyclohydrolase
MASLALSGIYIRETLVEDHKQRVSACGAVVLGIHICGENAVIERYVRSKIAYGKRIGVTVVVYRHPVTHTTDDLCAAVTETSQYVDALIVQLPLPPHIVKDEVLRAIPQDKDADVLHPDLAQEFLDHDIHLVPPVARAVEIALASIPVSHFLFTNVRVAVVGFGSLVGKPCAALLSRMGCSVSVIDETTDPRVRTAILHEAHVIVSGVGIPNLIGPDDISEGVTLLDAGTTASAGTVVGDISLECRSKAKYFAEVPGGIGPLTVASLFENVLILAEDKKSV